MLSHISKHIVFENNQILKCFLSKNCPELICRISFRRTTFSLNITLQSVHWEKNAIESIAFLSKSMYITDSNQYAIELVTYLLVLVVYFYEFIVYMLLERNAFDSIALFSQCTF